MLRPKELFATNGTFNQEGVGTCCGQHKGVAATTRHAHTKYSRHVSDVQNNFAKNVLREFAATIMYIQPGICLAYVWSPQRLCWEWFLQCGKGSNWNNSFRTSLFVIIGLCHWKSWGTFYGRDCIAVQPPAVQPAKAKPSFWRVYPTAHCHSQDIMLEATRLKVIGMIHCNWISVNIIKVSGRRYIHNSQSFNLVLDICITFLLLFSVINVCNLYKFSAKFVILIVKN